MLYPDIVKQGQKIIVSFSDLKSIQNGNHQSADFKLEENVKSLKRITPKVNVSSETWQKLQRDNKVESIVDHAMNLLGFVDYEICRNSGHYFAILDILKVQATVLLEYMVTV